RDRLHDGGRAVLLHELAPREGSRELRGRCPEVRPRIRPRALRRAPEERVAPLNRGGEVHARGKGPRASSPAIARGGLRARGVPVRFAPEATHVRLAKRIGLVKPSATLAVTAEVARLRATGVEVVDFGAGEPDFDTPQRIKDAALRALAEGATKYTPVAGTAAIRAAIVAKLARVNGLQYSPDETIATCGGKHALFNAFQALFEDGDEVLLPAPFWVSYADMLVLAGAKPVLLPSTA